MAIWAVEMRRLSTRVHRQLMRLGRPENDGWTTKGLLGAELGIDPDDEKLDQAARLLIALGKAESTASDLWVLRAR